MENLAKEVLKKYEFWQEIFELNSNTHIKDINEYCPFNNDKIFSLESSSCSGGGSCGGCGCKAD